MFEVNHPGPMSECVEPCGYKSIYCVLILQRPQHSFYFNSEIDINIVKIWRLDRVRKSLQSEASSIKSSTCQHYDSNYLKRMGLDGV